MNYKPNSHVMDLIMPDSREKGMTPQKIIEKILLDHYNNTYESVEDTDDRAETDTKKRTVKI